MKRVPASPRSNWQRQLESVGLIYHTLDDGSPYWDESVYYQFTSQEINTLESATQELDRMCLAAVDYIIGQDRFAELQVPEHFVNYVKQSWERDAHTIYGRFDFLFDGSGTPKLLEFNADTPTSLMEAAVVQWQWLEQTHASDDQFNSIHERLIEAWQRYAQETVLQNPVHFSCMKGQDEDELTIGYMMDVAQQAGITTVPVPVEEIGWNHKNQTFVDVKNQPILNMFKLYPWEWLMTEAFGQHIPTASTKWLEPAWKVLLSGKGLLPILWEMYPDHPYLLRASWQPINDVVMVRKPARGREGANVTILDDDYVVAQTDGTYDEGLWVYQEFQPPGRFDGNTAVIGSWLVNGYACGIGVREDDGLVTQNTSRFVPHLFRG
ncbi:MAG: glutathionylspermidine synthase family protein [Planctomycetia bacterium]|nr:glutathionylspermidine synthase family protein [Planctomycetia bacterium]